MKNIGKVDLLKDGWKIVKKEWKLIYALVFALIIYQIVQSTFASLVGEGLLGMLVALSFSLFGILFQIGVIKILLKLVGDEKAKFQDIWAYPKYLIKFIIASILWSALLIAGFIIFMIGFGFGIVEANELALAAFGIGLILLFIGIYFALRFQFYSYVLLDKDTGIIESFRKSWNLTRNNVINLTLFLLLIIGFNLIGALLFGVGLLLTLPISFVAVTILYRKLEKVPLSVEEK